MSRYDLNYGILSASRALLDAIKPNLRAVTIDIDSINKLVKVRFFYDGPISEDDYEVASTAMTEIISDFPADYMLDDDVIQLDYPNKVPVEGKLVFHRKE